MPLWERVGVRAQKMPRYRSYVPLIRPVGHLLPTGSFYRQEDPLRGEGQVAIAVNV
jgi:hypothetical protein